MSKDAEKPKMIAGPVHAETHRVMVMIWEAWRADIDAEVAADAASDVPLLTKPARWTLPRIDGADEMRLALCAWRLRREWCRCFRCDALNAVDMTARELSMGRAPLSLAPALAAEARAIAAALPKYLGGKRKLAPKAKPTRAPAPPKAAAAGTLASPPVADLPLFARTFARR